MLGEARQFAVRADYSHALISTSQRFLSSVLVLEPRAFLNATRKLTIDAPVAESPAEAVMAWFALKDAVVRGAECHHTWFHQRLDRRQCVFHPRPPNAPTTFTLLQVVSVLNDWATEYEWGFDGTHCWPPAIRARELLRANPDRLWSVDDLAKAVYVSSATLQRNFVRLFGTTVREYQARLRLRGVVEHLRASGECIEGILTERGYRSRKNAYRSFRRLSGMTLAEVRRLSETEYADLLGRALALPDLG